MSRYPAPINTKNSLRDTFHEALGWLAPNCRFVISGFVLLVVAFTGMPARGQTSPWNVEAVYYEPLGEAGFRSISGMATDPVSGEIYVLDAARHSVDVIDSSGFARYTFTHWITDRTSGQRSAGEPNSIAIAQSGDVFLTDFFSRWIDVLNIRGEVIDHIDILAEAGWSGANLRPEKLGLDSAGWLYASIAGDRNGVLRRKIDGGPAEVFLDGASEKIECITGMAVAADGRVAILDYRGTPAVRVYDHDGKLTVGFAEHDVEAGDLSFPLSLLFAQDGTYWVADGLRQAVKHYAADGKFLEYIGGFGAGPGNLQYPSALIGDGVAHITVAERVGRRLQSYVLPGALAAWEAATKKSPGADASSGGAQLPASSAVASEPGTER